MLIFSVSQPPRSLTAHQTRSIVSYYQLLFCNTFYTPRPPYPFTSNGYTRTRKRVGKGLLEGSGRSKSAGLARVIYPTHRRGPRSPRRIRLHVVRPRSVRDQ